MNIPGHGSLGMGAGMIVGLLVAIVIIGFVVWYFILNRGGGGTPSRSSAPLQSIVESRLPTAS